MLGFKLFSSISSYDEEMEEEEILETEEPGKTEEGDDEDLDEEIE